MFPFEVHEEKIKQVCSSHHVMSLQAFGSSISEQFNAESDIDLLVDFSAMEPSEYFLNYLSLKAELEIILNRKVDLVEEQSLRNPVLIRSINRAKRFIYGRTK